MNDRDYIHSIVTKNWDYVCITVMNNRDYVHIIRTEIVYTS